MIQRARGSGGGGSYYPKSRTGARALLEAIKHGGHLGILVDQKYNEGIPVPFFGHDAMTTTAPASFAIRYRIPLVPARVERLVGANFRVTVFPALKVPDSGDLISDTRTVMTEVNSLFERWIREKPEQWLWLHRRWPNKT